jgi:uncharacterized membrane protein
MDSRAKLLGHPIHQMLIVFPLGLLATAVAFDVVHLLTGAARWAEMAWWLIAVGVGTGLVAAVFGLIDWLAVPRGTRAKRIGLLHALGNAGVLALFGASWALRADAPGDPAFAELVPSFVGAGLSLVSGWLGGELVDRLGVGVDEGAHLDAPSSLRFARVPAGSAAGTAAGSAGAGWRGPERRRTPPAPYAGFDRRVAHQH